MVPHMNKIARVIAFLVNCGDPLFKDEETPKDITKPENMDNNQKFDNSDEFIFEKFDVEDEYDNFGGQLRNNLTNIMHHMEVPSIVMSKFTSIAKSNTLINVETCGLLAGKLVGNKYKVTHLLVPKQSKNTSDSCESESDIEVNMYQTKHRLLPLGWVSNV